jgi:hypothetical protein
MSQRLEGERGPIPKNEEGLERALEVASEDEGESDDGREEKQNVAWEESEIDGPKV